ncbi:hypothetical protein BGW39_010109 [Mortierella sp. 14UC]|nr:hypothetical protein BGW39_010109 [Mortierella sp. 14UC]
MFFQSDNTRKQEILSKYECNQEHHRQFYEILGQLTQLKVFELGIDQRLGQEGALRANKRRTRLVDGRMYFTGYGPSPDTPRLDLSSGLDRLKTLEKLEVFGFEGVDHRMAERWPRLRVMCGLGVPSNKQRVHMKEQRLSVQHHSNCF